MTEKQKPNPLFLYFLFDKYWRQYLIIFGLIMLLFIIFQPQGLYGMWLKMRIYWKLFPFNPKK